MFLIALLSVFSSSISIHGQSLYSLSCSNIEQKCLLYRIDIDLANERALSNEIAQWYQMNISDSFGSIAGFTNENSSYIIFSNNCQSRVNLLNIDHAFELPLSLNMPTPCTQPLHKFASRYLLGLGTISNGKGGSAPISLNVFDGISGQWHRGRNCQFRQEVYGYLSIITSTD